MPTTDERVNSHDVQLAVHTQQIGALMESHRQVVQTMNKLLWAFVSGSGAVALCLIAAIITLLAQS